MTPEPLDQDHARPSAATDADVNAAGKMTEALETLERARGHLYSFHQLIGSADLLLDEVTEQLEAAGRPELAHTLRDELVGRNVLPGRWTFQVVEEFDAGYWSVFRAHEQRLRDELTEGRAHVFEAEMKQRRRTRGSAGHEATP
jgi:hypothetical protein